MTSIAHAALALLLIIATQTHCIGQSGKKLVLSLAEGNRVLDSLKAREDWFNQNKIWQEQYELAQAYIADLDSTVRANNHDCDSTKNADLAEQKVLIQENDDLHESAGRVPWIVTLATLIGLLAGLVIAQ